MYEPPPGNCQSPGPATVGLPSASVAAFISFYIFFASCFTLVQPSRAAFSYSSGGPLEGDCIFYALGLQPIASSSLIFPHCPHTSFSVSIHHLYSTTPPLFYPSHKNLACSHIRCPIRPLARLVSSTHPTTGANISILTTTQSSIAADLDSFEEATWFTSSYLIAMSALAPLMGRLSQVFSPRLCMFFSTVLISVGSLVTSQATMLRWFLVGRSITGAGGAGILIVATIIVIQMVSARRRGLFIGLANTGMTVGLSLGAVIAGAAEPKIGWVGSFQCQQREEVVSNVHRNPCLASKLL